MIESWYNTGPHEECGVFGIYAPGRDVARLTFFGLYALQHRGQESAGIATCDGQLAHIHKAMGLVSQIFNEDNLAHLQGHIAVGHTRYSTTGGSFLRNAQPYLIETLPGPLAVAHNGNLTNASTLRKMLLERGVGLSSTADSEIITQILAAPPDVWSGFDFPANADVGDDLWIPRIRALMRLAEGAYSLVLMTRNALYAIRDPQGFRPFSLGKLDSHYVLASETCAFGTIGAQYIRYIHPGEILRIDADGLTSFVGHESTRRALCVFEFVYFARPDSLLDEKAVHTARQNMGRHLAKECPAGVDIVVGVPDSAIPAAIGYSLESGIPYSEGLIKNRYIGRTFIQPDEYLRKQGAHLKYNALVSNLQGKRVVLVDDSIVRGTTIRPLVQLLREGGAKEVHVRVSSPPVKFPCFMGVDMARDSELIGATHNVAEICHSIGADSLGYLSLPGLLIAIEETVGFKNTYCNACFSGDYPIPIPEWLFQEERKKFLFENMWGNCD